MAAFIGIACPWILVAVFLLMMQRRAEDPTAGQWRSEPSTFFGGPADEEASASDRTKGSPMPPPGQSKPAAASATVH